MSVLSDKTLKKLIKDKKLVTKMLDAKKQVQQCGVELTLAKIEGFETSGSIDFDNKYRSIPRTYEIEFGGIGNSLKVMPGGYLVTFSEVLKIPKDVVGIARPRSSLLRMGVTVETAVFDPGFEGSIQSLLIVSNPKGFVMFPGARLIQVMFMTLDSAVEQGYNGIYQGKTL
jgi:dUTP pyrophosphatase